MTELVAAVVATLLCSTRQHSASQLTGVCGIYSMQHTAIKQSQQALMQKGLQRQEKNNKATRQQGKAKNK